MEALLPAEGQFPAGVDIGLVGRIDEELWASAPETRAELKKALHVLEHVPPLLGHPHRFTRLAPAERLDVLTAMLTGERDLLAQVATAWRQLAHALYYGQPEVWAALSYDGPWVGTAKPPASALAYRAALEAT